MANPVRNVSAAPKAPAASTVNSLISTFMSAGNGLVSLLSGLLAAFLILYSGYVLYDTAYIQNQAFGSSWDLLQYKPEIIDEDDVPLNSAMASLNPDYRSWLTVFGTNIDYPVLQGEDDLYYSRTDIYGNTSLTGSIYLAAGNSGDFSDSYNIIYGHHMDNGAMFGGLDSFLEDGYRDGHRTGVIVTGSRVYDLNLFAVVQTDAYDGSIYCPGNNRESVIRAIDSNHVYYDSAAAAEGTKIVALSTCAGATTDGRLIVFFTMIERDLVTITAEGFEGVFDGKPHGVTYEINVEEDTVVEFSTDNGRTWSTNPPVRTVVGTTDVLVRATNPYSAPVTAPASIVITPRPVTVTADPASKVFGANDPEFSAVEENLVEGYPVAYTVSRPRTGIDENVGIYPNAIIPTGDEIQDNYIVTYVAASFEITPAPAPNLTVTGYNGVYDAKAHGPVVTADYPAGTRIEYSTDNGNTWSAAAPTITDVGTVNLLVRATNPNYETATATATLTVTPAPVTVTANDSAKVFGSPDPAGYNGAVVSGVLDGYAIQYTLSRPRQGVDEAVGTYRNAIVPTGAERQGNYSVTYVPGNFEITPAGTFFLQVTGYLGVYDTQPHGVTVNTDMLPEGTVLEYSTDGRTWSTTPPSRTDVGITNVTVRASNANFETATASAAIRVTPALVVVTANDCAKAYGEEDPEGYSGVTVTGVLDDFEISYTLRRPRRGIDETVGHYAAALSVTGRALQGNYTVSFAPGNFTINPAPAPVLNATGYTGVYDANAHSISVDTDTLPAGTTVEYSTDGRTWSTTPPSRTDVGTTNVRIRATNPNYETADTSVILRVTPRGVTVLADDARKSYGEPDPAFTARVEGVIDDYTIRYSIFRENAASSEGVGTYARSIIPTGDTIQGNYSVSYVAADFRILRTLPVPENPDDIIDDTNVPLAQFTQRFVPAGSGGRAWALVNLIALILTVYLFLPLFDLKPKFRRRKMLERYETDLTAVQSTLLTKGLPELEAGFASTIANLLEAVRKFVRRFRIGLVLELLLSVGALLLFLWTEDMRTPMILIDRWTPLQLGLLALCWGADVGLVRFKTGEMNEEILDTLETASELGLDNKSE